MVKSKLALALAMFAALSLAGCAPKYKGPDFPVHYYPDCYDPIDQMCKAQDNSKIHNDALKVTTITTLFTFFATLATTRDLPKAALFSLVEASASYLVTYGVSRLAQIKDQNERLEALKAQLGDQANDMDLTQASVEKAYRCYRARIAELKRGIKSGMIGKQEAIARADEIRAGMNSLRKFWQERDAAVQASLNEYDKFIADQEKKAQDAANQMRIAESRKAKARLASNAAKHVAANSKEEAEGLRELDDMRRDLDRA